jgi:hypothetical protein
VPEVGCGIDPPWYVEPAWLDGCLGLGRQYLLSRPEEPSADRATWGVLDPRLDAGTLPPIADGGWILADVEGRYDHPEARTCRAEANVDSWPEASAPPAPLVVLGCRSQFVITAVDPRS